MVGPPRSRPPGQLAAVYRAFLPILTRVGNPPPYSPLPPGQDAQGLPRALATTAERGKELGGRPPASCRPSFRTHWAQGRAQAGSGSPGQAGWGGRRRPRRVPGADHQAVVHRPFRPRAAQPPGGEREEPQKEE